MHLTFCQMPSTRDDELVSDHKTRDDKRRLTVVCIIQCTADAVRQRRELRAEVLLKINQQIHCLSCQCFTNLPALFVRRTLEPLRGHGVDDFESLENYRLT